MAKTPVSSLRNLGPAVEASCARAGIDSAETLREIGAHEAYRRLLATGTRPHFISYYVLHMALQGRPWNDCKDDEKAALRVQFDALKSARTADPDQPPEALKKFLRDMGLNPPTPR
ncbi:TfoX/Sxy family protein [Puniceibacterium sediminis]|uniref:TfoX C-terminal domain-containing protein n=1 Tax=Puniceibacterium sediminis TaxID=1608407 RepID=A0A238W5N9_9RHOB|nr:TfoX/Sxy family protein [Puniceibacterium sediminis]SNR41915.1 TfoX C-terminal domain-containing protein [Puniceibacterium sediminis]